jgi:hypothetical protein
VGIALGYGLDEEGSITGRDSEFFLRHRVQTGSGPHPASYPMSNGDSFPGSKAGGA